MIRNYKSWVTARLDESGVVVSVVGSAEYDKNGRAASIPVPVASEDMVDVKAALEALLAKYQARAEQAATLAAAQALSAAARLGEEI